MHTECRELPGASRATSPPSSEEPGTSGLEGGSTDFVLVPPTQNPCTNTGLGQGNITSSDAATRKRNAPEPERGTIYPDNR
jgi:hypothetical protein